MSDGVVEHADVVIVGAGLAGLAAAWHLRDRRVVVFEAAERVGGRLCSEPPGDLWLNFGAQVFGAPTSSELQHGDEHEQHRAQYH